MTDLSPKEFDLLDRLDDKPELRPHFFRKVKGLKWFKVLNERGYFKAENNPGPQPSGEEGFVAIPHWPATDYLVSIAPELANDDQHEIAREVLGIFWSVTQDAVDRGISNYRTWWQFAKALRYIPIDLINNEELNQHVSYWLKDPYDRGLAADELGKEWLPQLLAADSEKARSIALNLLRLLYTAQVHERDFAGSKRKEATFVTDNWHLEKITEVVARESGTRLGIEACQVFEGNLRDIIQGMDNDGYSCIWRPAIEDHKQNSSRVDALDILIVALRDSLSGYITTDTEDAQSYVADLLQSPLETFKRLAIHAITEHFDLIGTFTDQILTETHFQANLRHEMWHLLNRHYPDMPQEQQQATLDFIAAIEQIGDDGEPDPGHSAYTQATWLKAIRTHSPDLEKQYQQATELAGAEPEHPDFSSYHTSRFVTHESPISRDELLALSIDELVDFLANYRDPQEFRGPGIEGLVNTLKIVFKDEPLKYSPHLTRFVNLGLCYSHAVLDSYADIWKEKRSLPWDEIWAALLEFIQDTIDQDHFWSAEHSEQQSHHVANRHRVVSSIGRLIESGVQSDEHAFKPELLPQALDILQSLLAKQDGAEFNDDSDAVSLSINSARGKCIEALINLALRECRLADKDNAGHTAAWGELEALFTNELERTGNYEFATLSAMYLPNLLYLSEEWTLAHLGQIFTMEDQLRWRCAMQGYSYVNHVNEAAYAFLRDQGHLLRALTDESLRDEVSDKVIQHIVIAYLHGDEDLNDESSMIATLLARGESEEIGEIIWFLWTLHDKNDQELNAKVLELWPRIWTIINTETKEGKKLASRLCTWIAFLDTIDDDNRTLVVQSIRFADADHNGYQILEELARISECQPNEAAQLWMAMLEGSTPDYPTEAIQKIFTNLVATGEDGVRTAKEIASIYIKGGTERPNQWLNEIIDGGTDD